MNPHTLIRVVGLLHDCGSKLIAMQNNGAMTFKSTIHTVSQLLSSVE